MTNQLESSVKLVDNKVKFACSVEGKPEITVDYYPPIGTGEGYTSLELFLISLSTCASTSILSLLRKGGRQIEYYTVNSVGTRREQHPTKFDKIVMKFEFKAKGLTSEEVKSATDKTEQLLCPVWAMIKGNVEVETEFTIL